MLSRDDRRRDLVHKIRTYLSAGTDVVIVVDPKNETVVAHDVHAMRTCVIGETFTHAALPSFALDVRDCFARART